GLGRRRYARRLSDRPRNKAAPPRRRRPRRVGHCGRQTVASFVRTGHHCTAVYYLRRCFWTVASAGEDAGCLASRPCFYSCGSRCRSGVERQAMPTEYREPGWEEREVGVGPCEGDWPEGDHWDQPLLAEGDRRNLADHCRYWTVEAI